MKRKLTYFMAMCLTLGLLSGCGSTNEASSEAPVQNASTQEANTIDAAELVRDIYTVQKFTEEAVAEEDIQLILEAGIQAPSALNQQPWHFSVITDSTVLQQIAGDMGGGMPGAGAGAPPAGAEMPDMPEGTEMPNFDGNTPPEGMENPPENMPERPEGDAPAANGVSTMANKAGIADAPLVIVVSAKEGSEFDAGLACQNMSVEAQLLGYGTKIISSPTMALNGQNQAEYKGLLGIPEDQSAVAVLLIGVEDTTSAGDDTVDAASTATARESQDTMVTYIKPE